LKQLIKIEGLNEGHFTTAVGVEELVAPTEGLYVVEEELHMAPEESQLSPEEEEKKRERAWESIWRIEDDDNLITKSNEHGKLLPAVGNEGVTEHRDDDFEITVFVDQVNKGGITGLISSIPLETLYLGMMLVFGMLVCLVITAHKLRKRLFYHSVIEELVDLTAVSVHHKYT